MGYFVFLYLDMYRSRIFNSRMAKKDPKNAKHIVHVKLSAKEKQTKSNYVSVLRHWFKYCVEYDENPLSLCFDPEVVMFWMSERTQMYGSCASLCSWQSALVWLCDLTGGSLDWKSDLTYSNFKKDLRREYEVEADSRLPFELDHIKKFTIHNKCYGKYLKSVHIDILLIVLMAQLFFCVMTRPSELVWQKKSQSKFGLKYKHFKLIKPLIKYLNELILDIYHNIYYEL